MLVAATVYILAVMSPGPNFILVSRFALSHSTWSGIGASLGIVTVGLLFSTSSVLGLALLIERFPWFGRVATIAGTLYLLYIAFLLFRSALRQGGGAGDQDHGTLRASFWQAWRIGVLTNITNLKTIAFMISIFAGFLSVPRTGLEKALVIAICSTFELAWYSAVAVVFGQGGMQRFYQRYSWQIDVGLGSFLVLFALNSLRV